MQPASQPDPSRSLLPRRLRGIVVLGAIAVPGLIIFAWWNDADPWLVTVLAACLFAPLLALWDVDRLAAHLASCYPRERFYLDQVVAALASGVVATAAIAGMRFAVPTAGTGAFAARLDGPLGWLGVAAWLTFAAALGCIAAVWAARARSGDGAGWGWASVVLLLIAAAVPAVIFLATGLVGGMTGLSCGLGAAGVAFGLLWWVVNGRR